MVEASRWQRLIVFPSYSLVISSQQIDVIAGSGWNSDYGKK